MTEEGKKDFVEEERTCAVENGIFILFGAKQSLPNRALGDIYMAGDKVESLSRRAKWDSP